MDSELAQKSSAAAHSPVATASVASSQPVPDYGPNGQIDDDPYQSGPFSPAQLEVTTSWRFNTPGGVLVVYAGSSTEGGSAGTGAILVWHEATAAAAGSSIDLDGPFRDTSAGSLTIISADGRTLALTTNTGAQLHFDTTAESFRS